MSKKLTRGLEIIISVIWDLDQSQVYLIHVYLISIKFHTIHHPKRFKVRAYYIGDIAARRTGGETELQTMCPLRNNLTKIFNASDFLVSYQTFSRYDYNRHMEVRMVIIWFYPFSYCIWRNYKNLSWVCLVDISSVVCETC